MPLSGSNRSGEIPWNYKAHNLPRCVSPQWRGNIGLAQELKEFSRIILFRTGSWKKEVFTHQSMETRKVDTTTRLVAV